MLPRRLWRGINLLVSPRSLIAVVSVLVMANALRADLGVGSTRDEVLAQLGAPKSTTAAADREILGYPNGRITLSDHRVVSIDWKGGGLAAPKIVPPPTAAPSPPAVVSPPTPAVSRDAWTTDYAAAQAEAAASHRRLLVLFTGSDWCPACMQFEASVAHAEDFLNVTRAAFVLVKLDFPRNSPQPATVRTRNQELFRRYKVEAYPTLLIVSADGTKSQMVDNRRSRPASDIVDFYVQAVDEARRAKEKTASIWPW